MSQPLEILNLIEWTVLSLRICVDCAAMFGPGFLPTIPSLLRSPGEPLIHRDLSWLQFNERVLDEARSSENPPLERLKFLSITSSNLDEFFMIRMASLERTLLYKMRALKMKDSRRLRKIRDTVLESVANFGVRQEETLLQLIQTLEKHSIHFPRGNKWSDESEKIGTLVFQNEILPRLPSAEAFRPTDILTLENLQVGAVFASDFWIRIPKVLPTVFVKQSADQTLTFVFLLDELLARYLPETFTKPTTVGFVRLTRDGDISIEVDHPDPESIPDHVFHRLSTREQGRPTRLQYSGDIKAEILAAIIQASRLTEPFAIKAPGTLFLHSLWSLTKLIPECSKSQVSELRFPPLDSRVPKIFEDSKILFDSIRHRDFLLHHPYDSFEAFVKWIGFSADDSLVESIELTVYRIDTLSPIIDHLKRAAKQKRVRVIIELRARFDELNNLRLADELKKAGIEVGYGFGKLKLHAKIALITRLENGKTVLYTHLSTGNYNAATARQYTDLALITADPEIGSDARLFFDSVWDGKVPTSFKHLLVAPAKLARRLQALIRQEAEAAKRGEKARIIAKVNALVDEGIARSLYEASAAGVQIDLIVRGACSVIPGVKGLSENIRVVSIVDRFLEHSRIYYFGNSKRIYLSSADWMPRNFFTRLEIAFPILDDRIYEYLEKFLLPAYLNDIAQARELTPQGVWRRKGHAGDRNMMRSQVYFRELAVRQYKETPLEI